MLVFIIWMLILGLIAGGIARLLVPGPDPMGIAATILLGIVGSFLGGFLGELLFGGDDDFELRAAGIIGSIIGAVIVLLIWRAVAARGRART